MILNGNRPFFLLPVTFEGIFFRRPISIKVSYLKRGLGREIVLFSGCINKEVVSTFNLVIKVTVGKLRKFTHHFSQIFVKLTHLVLYICAISRNILNRK